MGEVPDGLFFAARQDHFAEVLVRLLDALGRPTLRGNTKHGRIHHRDVGFANEPDSLGQRNSSGAHRQFGCIPGGRNPPSVSEDSLTPVARAKSLGESNCFMGTLFIDLRPLSQRQSFYFDPKSGGNTPFGAAESTIPPNSPILSGLA